MNDETSQGPDPKKLGSDGASFGLNLTAPEIIQIFEQSLRTLKDYLLPILGETTLEAIFRNAIRENKSRHKFLSSIRISAAEVSIPFNHEGDIPIEPRELLCGILDFMQSIITLLTELTGDVLTRKLEPLLSNMEHILPEGEK